MISSLLVAVNAIECVSLCLVHVWTDAVQTSMSRVHRVHSPKVWLDVIAHFLDQLRQDLHAGHADLEVGVVHQHHQEADELGQCGQQGQLVCDAGHCILEAVDGCGAQLQQ